MQTVIDCETSYQVVDGKKDPSPFNNKNKLVSLGYNTSTGKSNYLFFAHNQLSDIPLKQNFNELQIILDQTTLLIGHNIKFDLEWLLECGFKYSGLLWDTMVCEYVFARGLKPSFNLNNVAKTYGFEGKDKNIEEYLRQNISFEDIPPTIIETYGRQDVSQTGKIFLQQEERLSKEDNILKPTVHMSMDFIWPLIAMERNGIKIDTNILKALEQQYTIEYNEIEANLKKIIQQVMGATPINLNSPEQLSLLIYSRKVKDKAKWRETFNIGSELRGSIVKSKYKTKMDNLNFIKVVREQTEVVYKTEAVHCTTCNGLGFFYKIKKDGNPFKKSTVCRACGGRGFTYKSLPMVAGLKAVPASYEDTADGGFVTDGYTLSILKNRVTTKAAAVIDLLIRRNKLSTYLDTFIRALSKVDNSSILHPSFMQCATATGRLSSRNPNFQNQPRGDKFPLRKVVVSRFDGGHILEGDYSQLEFRVAAELSDCKVAYQDIVDGVDIHAQTANILGCSRQDAKPDTFKPLYGGQTGTDKQQAYYSFFLKKYSGISAYHVKLQNEAVTNKVIRIPTGREYAFPNAQWMRNGSATFATKIKNYPVQGFATGDIVPISSILIYKLMIEKKVKSLLINEVHDSNIADVFPGEEQVMIEIFTQGMLGVKEELVRRYNYKLTVPLSIELKIGENWLELKKL